MRSSAPTVKPGWFFRNNRQYLALSEVPSALEVSSAEITEAVEGGLLKSERISGCKAVALEELFRYIEIRGNQK